MKSQGQQSETHSVEWRGPLWKILETHFFSHTHLRNPAEEEMRKHGLGLAHHRALVFISKYPGITAGELRKILQVSNQALGIVLGPLIRRGFIEQSMGQDDRRIRHLRLTKSGRAVFHAALSGQMAIVRQAVLAAGPDAVRGFLAVAEGLTADYSKEFIEPLDETSLERLFKGAPSKRGDISVRSRVVVKSG